VDQFTPTSAAIGGILIGLSATLTWLALGRIAGISGIVASLSMLAGMAAFDGFVALSRRRPLQEA